LRRVMNMKKLLSLLIFLYGSCLLTGCGAGNTTTSPPITVGLSPNTALALDVNQSVPITANVSNDPSNQGFDWALACDGSNCGTITAHTASGAPATFVAPASSSANSVTITAKLTGQTNSATAMVTVSPPPTVATTGAITGATLGSSYSLQLTANGGAGALTWALGGGTSLPDTLSLSGTGMITGTPSGASGQFNFKVHVTDSGSPPLTSPDVPLNITVGTPPISVALSRTSAFVALNGSTNFVATVTNDQPNGNVDWTLTLNGLACPVAECGSVSPITTTSRVPTTYTAPASVPPANIALTATTVDGTPPAAATAAIAVTAHGFKSTGNMDALREFHTATLLDRGPALTNGKVLVAGGNDKTGKALASAELFDPISGTFTAAKGSMGTPRAYHTATLLNDGTVLLTGGVDGSGTPLATAELFNPTTETFAPANGNMTSPRANHTATLLDHGSALTNGKVLVAGGNDSTGKALASAELFDPISGTFTPTKGSMETACAYHTATLLDHGAALTNGKVLVAGGGAATAELFDPGSETFTPTGSMELVREHHTATLLNDGTVLVTGGGAPTSNPNGQSSSKAELFDPKTRVFTPTKVDMTTRRTNHTATLLNDGTVLITGGFSVYPNPVSRRGDITYLATAEVFDPANGSFARTADMATARAYHTATSLKDGTVLVTGGVDGSATPLATAELYQ
jgi:hypothetical protein